MWIKISEKGTSIFLVLNLSTFFKVGKKMVPKYQHLILPEVFSDKVTPDIEFTHEAVVNVMLQL